MAKQTINIGSSEFSGDGESIRSAFAKTNSNFDEVYSAVDTLEQTTAWTGLPQTFTGDVIGSVFANESTLLVDGENGKLLYQPGNATHWANPLPTSTTEALDRIAAAVYTLNSNTPI